MVRDAIEARILITCHYKSLSYLRVTVYVAAHVWRAKKKKKKKIWNSHCLNYVLRTKRFIVGLVRIIAGTALTMLTFQRCTRHACTSYKQACTSYKQACTSYKQACTHSYIYTYIHAYIHTYTYTFIYLYIHTCMHACMHLYIYAYIYTYAFIHLYMYTFIHLCIYIYIVYIYI